MAGAELLVPRGPNVDISLFPQAAAAGTNIGNAQKTMLQGIAEGITGGIQGYEAVRQSEADIAYKEAQVEQMPVEMQIKRQQLLNQQAETNVNLLRAQIEQAKLKNNVDLEAQKAQNELMEEQGIGEVNGALASQNPDQLNGLLGNQKALAAMNKDSHLREAVTGRALSMLPDGPERNAWINYDSAQKQMDRVEAQRRADAKFQETRQKNYDEAEKGAYAVTTALLNGRDLNRITHIEMYPVGQKSTDEKGRIIGTKELSGLAQPSKQEYEVFEDGILVPGMTYYREDYDKFKTFKDAYNALHGNKGVAAGEQQEQTKPQGSPVAIHQNINLQELQGQPGVQKPFITGNNRIVEQKINESKKIFANAPQGISEAQMNERFQSTNQKLQEPTVPPVTAQAKPSFKPTSYTPQTSSDTLTETLNLGVPVSLHLTSFERPESSAPLTDWTPKPRQVTDINTNPLVANESPLIKAMTFVESAGGKKLLSPTGVVGIMQVTKDVANIYGLNRNIPEENLLAGKKYIADLLTQFNGDYRLALTAYNAGPGTVRDAVKATGSTDWPDVQRYLKGHLSPSKYKEVADYANKVIYTSSYFVQPGNPDDEQFVSSLAGNGLVKSGKENLFNKPLEEVLETNVEEPKLPKAETKPVTPNTAEIVT